VDHDGYIPAFATVTDAKTHECLIAKAPELPKGSIVVFDKGFISYPWFRTLGAKGVFFVWLFIALTFPASHAIALLSFSCRKTSAFAAQKI
jgi:hypothetical protein